MSKDKIKNSKTLNRFEQELQDWLSDIMKAESKKFTAFLHVLVDGVPQQGTEAFKQMDKTEYLKINKKEYIKFIRSSFTVEEVYKIFDVLNYEFIYTLNGQQINVDNYILQDTDNSKIRLKFVDLMASCSLLGIDIKYQKIPMQGKNTTNTKLD